MSAAREKPRPINVAEKSTPETIAGHARFRSAGPDSDDGYGYPTFADADACRAVIGLANGKTITEPLYVRDDVVNTFSNEVAEEAIRRERARIYKLLEDADCDGETTEGLQYAMRLIRQNGGSS